LAKSRVGKSSLLDALTLLAASAAGRLNDTLSDLGGVSSLVTRGSDEHLGYSVSMAVPEHEPLDYQLEISGSGVGYKIESEKLSQMHSGYEMPFLYIRLVR
jgi:predicted ATPase